MLEDLKCGVLKGAGTDTQTEGGRWGEGRLGQGVELDHPSPKDSSPEL